MATPFASISLVTRNDAIHTNLTAQTGGNGYTVGDVGTDYMHHYNSSVPLRKSQGSKRISFEMFNDSGVPAPIWALGTFRTVTMEGNDWMNGEDNVVSSGFSNNGCMRVYQDSNSAINWGIKYTMTGIADGRTYEFLWLGATSDGTYTAKIYSPTSKFTQQSIALPTGAGYAQVAGFFKCSFSVGANADDSDVVVEIRRTAPNGIPGNIHSQSTLITASTKPARPRAFRSLMFANNRYRSV